MKILVTGAKGFVGKNLCIALTNVIDGKDKTRKINTDITLFQCDVDTSAEEFENYCSQADFVFNLAGVNKAENSEAFAEGNEDLCKKLTDALKKLGLEEINPINEEFDVNFHQAVMRVEDDSVGNNIVVEVLQSGYKLGDNVLRYAMVKVANCD